MTLQDQVDQAVRLAQSLHAKHPHLQEAFDDPSSAAFWAWLNTHGWKDIEGVSAALPPVPGPDVYAVSNASNDWGYILTAASTYVMLDAALQAASFSWSQVQSILDFGCGPARGVRCLLKHATEMRVFGCDVDENAIDWCNKSMPYGNYAVNQELPPLPYESNQFDLVFSVSVFSHLSKESQNQWLPEIARITRPGGLAILTIHGEHALARANAETNIFDMLCVDKELFDAACHEVTANKGFAFIPQPTGHLTTDLYGATFMHSNHVKSAWTQDFELVDIIVGIVDNWQDAVVLRKK